MSPSADPHIARKITRLYLLALTAVALLSVGGQLLVQRSLRNQQSDAKVINLAGRQRMLSQKISKNVLLLNNETAKQNIRVYKQDLAEALALWKKYHNGLKNERLEESSIEVNNSNTIQQMFNRVDPYFKVIYANAVLVQQHFQQAGQTTGSPTLQNHINAILKNEPAFLQGMDLIVFQYDAEASRRVNDSKRIEYILSICTLGILLLEGFFIFRPAVNQIQYTISLLINSEQRTQKVNAELVQANKLLEETRGALLEATNQKYQQEMNEQKLRSAYLIQGQEEERKRVALEIHDGLGQMLTALKYGIEKISNAVDDSERARKSLVELHQLVSQTINEARIISYNLMPAVLSDFGISSALKLLASQVSTNTGRPVSFKTNVNGDRFSKNIEIGLYRVSQEAIHNAVKYAGAQEITMELSGKKKNIHLTITDNGRGFNYEEITNSSEKTELAHGISNMKERVFIINGQITLESKPGKGTRVHVKIPIQHPAYAKN